VLAAPINKLIAIEGACPLTEQCRGIAWFDKVQINTRLLCPTPVHIPTPARHGGGSECLTRLYALTLPPCIFTSLRTKARPIPKLPWDRASWTLT
jgi:hypothetical protein